MNYNDKIYGITKTCLECFGLHQNVGTLCTSCLSKQHEPIVLDKDFYETKPFVLNKTFYNALNKLMIGSINNKPTKERFNNKTNISSDLLIKLKNIGCNLNNPTIHDIQQYFIDNQDILILVDIDVTISYIYKINSIYPDAKWQGYKQSTYVYSTYNEALLAGIEEVINILNIE